jgi:mono/diheme cytochrome c family protein
MKNKRPHWLLLSAAAIAAGALLFSWAGNNYQSLRSERPPFQLRYDMQYQDRVSAQQPSAFFADRKSMLNHVPGTVPRDGSVFTDTSYQQTETVLASPVAQLSAARIERGANRFNAFCSPCHSGTGQDTTEVVRRGMQKPPNLAAPNAKGYSDQRLFYVVSKGQNVMPGYADKLTPEDRWNVIGYVRQLQRAPLRNVASPAIADSTTTTAAGK